MLSNVAIRETPPKIEIPGIECDRLFPGLHRLCCIVGSQPLRAKIDQCLRFLRAFLEESGGTREMFRSLGMTPRTLFEPSERNCRQRASSIESFRALVSRCGLFRTPRFAQQMTQNQIARERSALLEFRQQVRSLSLFGIGLP